MTGSIVFLSGLPSPWQPHGGVVEGAGRAIVPAIVCSGTQAQEKRTGTGTKWHMAEGSRRVRQEPSGEKVCVGEVGGGVVWHSLSLGLRQTVDTRAEFMSRALGLLRVESPWGSWKRPTV